MCPDGPKPQPAAVSEKDVPACVCNQFALARIHLTTTITSYETIIMTYYSSSNSDNETNESNNIFSVTL